MTHIIICPSCKTKIDLDKISEDKYRSQLEAEFEKERDEMRRKAQAFAEQKMQEQAKKDAVEMQDLKNRLDEAAKKQEDFQKQELNLRKKQRELEEKEKNRELEMQRKLDEEKAILEKKIEKQMAESGELALKKQLEDQRRKDEEIMQKREEEFRKKELEYLKQQDQLKRSLDDAKRKAEQGSQQIQGDIQEEDLKQSLQMAFPIDDIGDVATGVKGADLIQVVKNNLGQSAGIIVWESKNTKSWQDAWLMKLKDDKLKVAGNIAILVSGVLPKGLSNFGVVDDVMICEPKFAIAVAGILRERILAVHKTEKASEGKDAKMEMLYKYLSSEEFGSKMYMMIDVFSNLKAGIDAERRAMEKNWKKREKDLERATFAVTGMYGELESLMGMELPGGEKLQLQAGEDEEEN